MGTTSRANIEGGMCVSLRAAVYVCLCLCACVCLCLGVCVCMSACFNELLFLAAVHPNIHPSHCSLQLLAYTRCPRAYATATCVYCPLKHLQSFPKKHSHVGYKTVYFVSIKRNEHITNDSSNGTSKQKT